MFKPIIFIGFLTISWIIEIGWFAQICSILEVKFGDNLIGLNIIHAWLSWENVMNTVQSIRNNKLYKNINWDIAKWRKKD